MIVSCTQRNNPIGNSVEETPHIEIFQGESLFDYSYSFEDSLRSSYPSDKLLVGTYNSNTSVTLLRFANFPEPVFSLQSDAELRIGVKGSYNASGMVLSLGIIKQNWFQEYATWDQATRDEKWSYSWLDKGNMELLDSIDYTFHEGDSLITFKIPASKMHDFISKSVIEDPMNYGLAIYVDRFIDKDGDSDKSYLELFTKDSSDGPTLIFEFLKDSPDASPEEYERKAMENTFINSVQPQLGLVEEGIISISNMPPKASVIKFNTGKIKNFFSGKYNFNTEKITINKAELVLFLDQNNQHFSPSTSIQSIIPYNLKSEYKDSDILPIITSDYERIDPTYISSASVHADSIAVNITTIIQAYISSIRNNNGILFRSTAENKDNTNIKFFPVDSIDENKRPYLKIIYSHRFTN